MADLLIGELRSALGDRSSVPRVVTLLGRVQGHRRSIAAVTMHAKLL